MSETVGIGKPPRRVWDRDERRAWTLPERLKPSEWAERYRVLRPGDSDIPGPWRNANAPYMTGIIDAAVIPGVVQMNIMKFGQGGISEGLRNLIGYWADTDPDPLGLALPDRVKGRKIVSNRIIPMFESNERLARLLTEKSHDVQKEQIRLLNGFLLHLMWAGSPSSTSADPMRRVINDEVDKPGFSEWGGAEPNAVGRTWTRMRTYGERKLQLNVSTPTTRMGMIFQLFDASDYKFYYHVACPECGCLQRLNFRNLKWEKIEESDAIRKAAIIARDDLAFYECEECKHRIKDREKPALVRAGRWSTEETEDQDAIDDLEAIEKFPPNTRLGFQISALCCLWEPWSNIVGQFLRAQGHRGLTYSFRTETLGEPWEEQAERTTPSVYSEKCKRSGLAEGTVPAWAVKLLTSIDTQHDHFYLVHRAWGPGMKSQRVYHTRAETFAQLDQLCFKTPYAREGGGPPLVPELVVIDSGGTRLAGEKASRTLQVYRWATLRRARVRALKGATHLKRDAFIWRGTGYIDDKSRRKKREITIWYLNRTYFQDLLSELIGAGVDPPEGEEQPDQEELWLLNENSDHEYNLHMSNVHKIVVPRGDQLEYQWTQILSGAPDHYRDCEVYNLVAAHMAGVHVLPSTEQIEQYKAAHARAKPEPKPKKEPGERSAAWDIRRFKDKI